MTFLTKFAEEYRAKWQAHIRPEIAALAARPQRVTWAEYEPLRMNSYEQEEIMPNLDDDALTRYAECIVKNCQPDRNRPASCYDDALALLVAPLLIARLRATLEARP